MNPMALMKLMSAKNKFNANHPKVGAFFKAAFGSGLQEGTILELTVTKPDGQSFAFHGYLPIEPGERAKKIKALEQRVYAEHQTQLFIETPYRNNKMVEDILHNCRPQTRLCIAANITCEGEYIRTKTIKEWQGKVPDLTKIPCIFLLYQ